MKILIIGMLPFFLIYKNQSLINMHLLSQLPSKEVKLFLNINLLKIFCHHPKPSTNHTDEKVRPGNGFKHNWRRPQLRHWPQKYFRKWIETRYESLKPKDATTRPDSYIYHFHW